MTVKYNLLNVTTKSPCPLWTLNLKSFVNKGYELYLICMILRTSPFYSKYVRCNTILLLSANLLILHSVWDLDFEQFLAFSIEDWRDSIFLETHFLALGRGCWCCCCFSLSANKFSAFLSLSSKLRLWANSCDGFVPLELVNLISDLFLG